MQMNYYLPAALLAVAAFLQPDFAKADTVIYDAVNFVTGQQSDVQAFTVSSAGTLTASLSDVPWLDTLQDMTFFLTSASGSVGSVMGPGTETFSLTPGTYYAHWAAIANGTFKVGVDKLDLQFQPIDGTTAVPLPGSLVLMLGGFGLLFGWQRRAEARRLSPVGAE